MTEFTVTLVEEDEEKTVKILNHVPTRIGIKTRGKMDVQASGQGKKVEFEMDNPQSKFEQAKLFLVEEMLERSPNCDLDVDDIDYESFNEIARHYWKQVQGERAKNSNNESGTTSE